MDYECRYFWEQDKIRTYHWNDCTLYIMGVPIRGISSVEYSKPNINFTIKKNKQYSGMILMYPAFLPEQLN